jgi:hypothetical protein
MFVSAGMSFRLFGFFGFPGQSDDTACSQPIRTQGDKPLRVLDRGDPSGCFDFDLRRAVFAQKRDIVEGSSAL